MEEISKKEKAKLWVKKHARAIAGAAIGTMTVGAAIVWWKRLPKGKPVDIPEALAKRGVEFIYGWPDGTYDAAIDKVSVKELGVFGSELLGIHGVTEETNVSMLLGINE